MEKLNHYVKRTSGGGCGWRWLTSYRNSRLSNSDSCGSDSIFSLNDGDFPISGALENFSDTIIAATTATANIDDVLRIRWFFNVIFKIFFSLVISQVKHRFGAWGVFNHIVWERQVMKLHQPIGGVISSLYR